MINKISNMNQNKKCILFIGDGISLAHVVRTLTLANSLNLKEYEVHFATSNGFEDLIDNPNFHVHELETENPKVFYQKLKKGKALFDSKLFKKFIRADLDLIAKVNPDLIVADFRPSMSISSELVGIPFVALSNGYWSPFSKVKMPVPDHPVCNFLGHVLSKTLMPSIFKFVFYRQVSAIRTIRKNLGLQSLRHSCDAYNKATMTAYLDIPDITPMCDLPKDHVFLGPVLWEPSIDKPNIKLHPKRKIIYLTLGSSGALPQIEDLIDHLVEKNFQIITTSPVRKRDFVFSQKRLPGIKIAKMSDLVVCHGGSGTVYQALYAGKPIVSVCSNLDQQLAMASVEKMNIGKSILYRKANTKNIVNTCIELLENFHVGNSIKIKNKITPSETKQKFNELIKQICPPTIPKTAIASEEKRPSQLSKALKTFSTTHQNLNEIPLLNTEDGIQVRIAKTAEQKEKAYKLMYEIYLEKGYIKNNTSEMYFTEHELLQKTITLLAIKNNEVVGTMTIIPDSPFGLPAEKIYSKELKDLKSNNRVCEITSLGIKKNARFSTNILIKLINLSTLYSTKILKMDYYIITVNPRHVLFYEKKLLFNIIGSEKKCLKVDNAPAILLSMNLNQVEDAINTKDTLIKRRLFKNFLSVKQSLLIAENQKLNQLYNEPEMIS